MQTQSFEMVREAGKGNKDLGNESRRASVTRFKLGWDLGCRRPELIIVLGKVRVVTLTLGD